jgi:putative Mg2+ transporter-C (MgtC) family protein
MDQLAQDVIRDMHFDVALFVGVIIKVAVAWALSFPLAVERARDDRSAGLRTFPVVGVASCGYVILAGQVLGFASPQQTNILQGLVTGIGFIGGGAIVKDMNRVRGTATAAAIWATGIIGAAVGYGRFEIACVVCIFTALPLYSLSRYEATRDLQETDVVPAAGPAPSPTRRGPTDGDEA